ncbi:M24 family metallopeptidase [Pseudooceanicola sp. GBMRC 2024]|uniref:M24 family metallopeptidase n=1 Tax=Pseudooceanicola albus TaxID=2692189 RepID=A0A6L7G2X3_9RHOB|nr:Xaa-Pro peptidase family protein [Pseudooceanicola albus]MXN17807.1 M24 family metallopeptidase [Pseudooceanicola albus]
MFFINEGTGPLLAPNAFEDAEFERRLEGTRKLMAAQGLDALICFAPENLYYLTNHDTPGYYWYQACVVTHDHKPVNVIRKLESTNTLGRSWQRLVVGYEDIEDPIEATLWLLKELGVDKGRVGYESETFFLTPSQLDRLREGAVRDGVSLVAAPAIVETMRSVKSEPELDYIRQGGKILSEAMKVAFETAGDGVTERAVAAKVNGALIAHGSGYQGLPTFLGTGDAPTLAHHTWSDRVMGKGDWLSYEVSASVERYTCAMFRMGCVGKPSDEFMRMLHACEHALENILSTAKEGVTAGEVFAAGNQAFLDAGYDDGNGRRLGYAVGVSYPPDWGEGHIIDLRRDSDKVLKAGMTFHTTPGLIYYPTGVVNISETFIVQENGTEVVTDYPQGVHIV